MPDLLEPVTGLEEVSSAQEGETVGSVDLTMVSQQLERIEMWQVAQFGMLAVIFGCVLGVALGKVVAKIWK